MTDAIATDLTDIKAVSRSLKSELGLRPIFHHLDDSIGKLVNPLSVLSLFVSVYCPIKVLPGPPSIPHHEVVLAKFEEAEHVEGIEGQCLIVEAEREAVVAVECMRPAKLGIDHHGIGAFRPHTFE